MKKKNICNSINNTILQQAAIDGTLLMGGAIFEKLVKIKKEELLKQYLEMGRYIRQLPDGTWYTKTNPHDRNHSGKMTAKTKESLEDKVYAYMLDIGKPEMTLAQVYSLFIDDYLKNGGKNQTIERGKYDWKTFPWPNIKITNITTDMLFDYFHKIRSDGITKSSYKNRWSLLNLIFEYAKYDLHLSVIDIATTRHRINKKLNIRFISTFHLQEELALSPKECNTILKWVSIHKDYALSNMAIAFTLATGVRNGELVALKCCDISTEYLSVRRMEVNLRKDGKTAYEIIDYCKTDTSVRQIILYEEAKAILAMILEYRKRHNIESEWLFTDEYGNRLTSSATSSCLIRMDKRFNFEFLYSMHDLRRTFATREHLLHNRSLAELQHQLGHSLETQTAEYIKASDDYYRQYNFIN